MGRVLRVVCYGYEQSPHHASYGDVDPFEFRIELTRKQLYAYTVFRILCGYSAELPMCAISNAIDMAWDGYAYVDWEPVPNAIRIGGWPLNVLMDYSSLADLVYVIKQAYFNGDDDQWTDYDYELFVFV